ncbi:MAG: ribonuclease III [Nakamurella sp.]
MSSAARAQNAPDPALLPSFPVDVSAAVGIDLEPELAVLALTHRSFAYENGGLPTNERLEFLGDSVLGIVVTEELYLAHPTFAEGQLAKLRASIVNMHALASVARAMNLGTLLRLGHGEELTGGREKASILADAVEALLGAIYLQCGLEPTRGVIHQLFHDLIAAAPSLGAGLDWKTSLQELAAVESLGVPVYEVTEEGPDHLKTFSAVVFVGGQPRGDGSGRTKKEAEQRAASTAYSVLTEGNGTGPSTKTAADTAAGAPDTD